MYLDELFTTSNQLEECVKEDERLLKFYRKMYSLERNFRVREDRRWMAGYLKEGELLMMGPGTKESLANFIAEHEGEILVDFYCIGAAEKHFEKCDDVN